jgi:hypothetical protein
MYSVYVIVVGSTAKCKKELSRGIVRGRRTNSVNDSLISLASRGDSHAMAVPTQIQTSVHIERHYAVAEIAEMWSLSPDKVRELFENEPGVLVIGERSPRHKRRYVTLRIPQTVLERVHSRLSLKSTVR